MKLLLILLTLVTACSSGGRRNGGWATKDRSPQDSSGTEAPDIPAQPHEEASAPHVPSYESNAPLPNVGAAPADPLYAYGIPAGNTEFTLNYGAEGHLIRGGLLHGMNDLRHASDGAWESWADAVTPRGGVLRLWVRYEMDGFEQDHITAARRAVDAGLTVMVTAVGTSEQTRANIHGERYALDAPSNPVAWADQVARDVERLRAANIPVTHIEIWNEPNLGQAWDGTPESFGTFFATVGKRLREKFGTSLKIGGPGLAGTLGDKSLWVNTIFQACKRIGFQPDFYSFHRYGSYPSDHDMLDVPESLMRLALAAGIQAPEIILSEWNIGLPEPTLPALEDQRAANYYMATVIALAQTPCTDAQFFFMQDAPWDTHKEFAGESVGVFSLAGAPKAILSGMRMMATAADLPMVPMERTGGSSNLSVFGSRQGSGGYLLAVNTFGSGTEDHINIMLRAAGVDLSQLKKNVKPIKNYVAGRGQRSAVERLGLEDFVLHALDVVRTETGVQMVEQKKADRHVRILLKDSPKKIVSVQLLSAKAGNPIVDAAFLQAYKPYAKGLNSAAGAAALEQLRGEGVDEQTLARLDQAMRQKQTQIAGVDKATAQHAREVFDQQYQALRNSVPHTLSTHPAAKAQVVGKASWCTLENGILDLRLPPETSVLVEFAW